MVEGKLIVSKKNILQIPFITKKGNEAYFNIKESELSAPLLEKKKNALEQLNNLEVEFEQIGGQPVQIREKGQKFNPSKPQLTDSNPSTNKISGDFHNPYNFIPALPRNTDKIQNSELGDRTPWGHSSYRNDSWSGTISVKLTVATPLLIPDAAKATVDEKTKKIHDIYPLRVGVDGKPLLPATSIKGMLRSAFEAITNSRMGIFEKHEDRLAYRMPANIGLQMVPAQIENGKIFLYPGTSDIGNDGKPQQEMYAAWLPRYNRENNGISNFAVKYPPDELPQHRQAVTAWLEKYRKTNRDGGTIFTYWRVRKIKPAGETLGNEPNPGRRNGSHQPTGDNMIKVEGFVYISNKNIDKKHDERLFFCYEQEPIEIDLSDELEKKWKELIKNYQQIHKKEIEQGKTSPPALKCSEWSHHITAGESKQKLSNGTLCYAHVNKNGNDYNILDLYPVMITRGLYEVNPESLLDESLKPATQINKLSPADRVFGWVNQNGKGAYKGQLRISSVKCESDNAIQKFERGLTLAILGEPKPEQTRFYAAENAKGESLKSNTKKIDGYKSGKGLRGRKVYPHHQVSEKYWDVSAVENKHINIDNRYREYLRVGGEKDSQNRTIEAWVKPETEFSFDIDIINLSTVELGALIWLLQLPENQFHRLGGGKPLGFGSVKLNIQDTDLRTGQEWKKYYSSLIPITKPEQKQVIDSSEEFKRIVKDAYEQNFEEIFEEITFVAAFLQTAKGFNTPIHYPRTTKQPLSEGESFKWFVENSRLENEETQQPYSLGFIVGDTGLPILEVKSKK